MNPEGSQVYSQYHALIDSTPAGSYLKLSENPGVAVFATPGVSQQIVIAVRDNQSFRKKMRQHPGSVGFHTLSCAWEPDKNREKKINDTGLYSKNMIIVSLLILIGL